MNWNSWIELSLLVLGSIVFVALLMIIITLSFSLKRLSVKFKKASAENFLLKEKIAELNDRGESKKLEQTEGFIKFISESRDWAFQYIEKVQIAIKNFQDVFHPFAVQYYENKRTRIPKEEFPAIVEAYKKLVEELPDEGKKK